MEPGLVKKIGGIFGEKGRLRRSSWLLQKNQRT